MAARLNKNQQILIKKSSCTNIMKSMWVVLKSPWWTQRHEGVFAKTCVIGGLYVCVIGGLYVELNDLQAAVHICSSSTSWEATATFICLSLSYRMQCCVDCCDGSQKRTAAALTIRSVCTICSSSTSWKATATSVCLSLSYRMQCYVDCCDGSQKRTAAALTIRSVCTICSSITSWEATATFLCLSLSYRMQCCVDCCDDSRKRTAAAFEVRAALAPYTAIECPGPPWFSPGLCEPLIIVSHIEPLIFVFILQPLLFVLTMYPFNFNGQAMHLFWYRTTLLPGLNLGLWSVGLWSVGL